MTIKASAADTSAVRATFIIDPNDILHAMVYYPMSNGRLLDEFLHLLDALQTSDEHKVATPEGWRLGDRVIVPPAATATEADACVKSDEYECVDFYYCTKQL